MGRQIVARTAVMSLFLLTIILAYPVSGVEHGDRVMDEGTGAGPLPPPEGYVHRPIVEFFTGLSCPSCMGGPHYDMERLLEEGYSDPSQPYTGVVFHELNGGGVDDLATDESRERMRHYQPGISGTPDAEFDGGYIELGGMTAPGGAVTYENGREAVERCREREDAGINPRHPLQNLRNPFKYVSLRVKQFYEPGVITAMVEVEYLGSSSVVPSALNAEVYAFVTEMNVTAYSLVEEAPVVNNFVFRGYAIRGETITLSPGESETLVGEWRIPRDLPVPVKPHDLLVVAAVYDLDDTSSEYMDSGNIANVPRAVQSSNPLATAYDGGWDPPEVRNIVVGEGKGGSLRVEAYLESEKGITSAYLLYSRDRTQVNYTALKMNLTGEEICDESGVCYAYGPGTAYVEFSPPEGWGGRMVIVAYDSEGVPVRSEYINATSAVGGAKEAAGGLKTSTYTYGGLILIIIGLVLLAGKLTSRVKAAWGIWAALLLLAAGTVTAVYPAVGGGGTSRAPDFTVETTEGERLSLDDLAGKVILLDVMSTTCSGCEEVLQIMEELYPEYRGEVVFISVSVDPADTMEVLRTFKEENGIEWIVASDVNREIFTRYGITQIPKLYVIDGEGRITYEHLGPPKVEDLDRALGSTLAGSSSPLKINTLGGGAGLTAIALLAGIMMFFSPCSFPLLPGYISYTVARTGTGGVRKGIKMGLVASLGIFTLFLLLGVVVALLGWTVSRYLIYLEPLIGVALVVLGIALFRGVNIPIHRVTQPIKGALYRVLPSRATSSIEGGSGGFFAYGLGYAAGAASCTTPVLLAVVFLGLSAGGFLGALYTFVIFSLAMATLMVLFTALSAAGSETLIRGSRRWMHVIEKAGAIVLIVVGIYFIWYFLNVEVL